MPKPNYAFEKRQRELAKKKKQDEKDARKREARAAASPDTATDTAETGASLPDDPSAPGPRVHLRKPGA
ncbi:hypothetical protein [Thermomonas haemolytica]|uniref:Uncharacterized protein n=1 Tax=Thermomonas haemolytica TaxID=141949 RepID=A0A4R3N0K8_9GAMM|nr:hypothetical protein [Thermomonas haemolytica]TCT22558.1 hypothetical protein EDC34_107110 [Thermomonas haemolytica]TNY29199.1 hypothetical protein BV505_05925 [Thermomonas haemolytica]